ncbi:F5/8 type C domain-containing protein [Kribbella sp. VKM Ac-2527]|uniref:F5/8 type C domain-containing protein n=1 Tax=Kribbella caucasensis TaxID=2512215 RepID=A0A4R6J3Y0_9ACTN|nr:discoidin domain-containing protein [Kribbella sp. VKM Ac-2527]TDO29647.1 F5/8 type C domain-containing protein [Kribbella sp. VKM Ac-2527]
MSARLRSFLSCLLAVSILVPLTAPSTQATSSQQAAAASAAGVLDDIVFGDAGSEAAHRFAGPSTAVVEGALGEPARVAKPTDPPSVKAGELRFTVAVDPVAQNYFTVKFWGSDASPYKTIAYINGEQIGYRRSGDYEAINPGAGKLAPDRFYYTTIMLPNEHTRGQRAVEIMLRTYDGGFSSPVTQDSRKYYRAYTHTTARLDVSGEKQGTFTPPTTPATDARTEAQKQALIDGYTKSQLDRFNGYSATIDAAPDRKLSIIRYQDDLRFYAQSLVSASWVPATTPEQKRAALLRIFKVIDNHARDYYGNTRLVLRGGHQGDWGGYYGALGEALYIVENLIKDDTILGRTAFDEFLDQPFVTNTVEGPNSLTGVDWSGGQLTRREAWERVLKANFDFARSRLSYIYNQVLYTYEGAWEAHEGLGVIGSTFYEGKARSHRILLESVGAAPFLGEEVLVGPDGRDLNLFHSLFYHDGTARFTTDTADVVGKGLAKSKLDAQGNVVRRKPYGTQYVGITKAGLTRENTYVANYGEAANYLPEYYHKTLGHSGDEALNDQILKLALRNLHARGFARTTDLDDNGERIMRMEMVVDERNTAWPGFPGYAVRQAEGKSLLYAGLEKAMADAPERYTGAEWSTYWQYAAEAVGFAQQELADNQYFKNFASVTAKSKVDLWLGDTYAYVTRTRADHPRFGKVAAGVVHPFTDFRYYTTEQLQALGVDPADYQDKSFADVDNMFVSFRDGDTQIFGSLFERQRGVAGNGRLHVRASDHQAVVQIATNSQFRYSDYWARMDNIDVDFMEDQVTGDGSLPQALVGEIAPEAYQPGVGEVRRENFEVDTPYSGYPDLLTARYGKYFFAVNTTRVEYGNKRTFPVELPSEYRRSTVLDLVSGKELPVTSGKVLVGPETLLVLKLDQDAEVNPAPHHVDYLAALRQGTQAVVSWKPAPGAATYDIKRADRQDGPFFTVAKGVPATSWTDRAVAAGKRFYYTVTPVNAAGPGWSSQVTELATTTAVGGWSDNAVGQVGGWAWAGGGKVAIQGANGAGLGTGDDYDVEKRDIRDSFRFASQVLTGSGAITAKIGANQGSLAGIMLRDRLTATDSRYVYLGADESGKLVLRNRTRDSRHDWQDDVRSPLVAKIADYQVSEYPYVRLVRDVDSQHVQAWASKDGQGWTFVGELLTPLPEATYAGVVSTKAATFDQVVVRPDTKGTLYARAERDHDKVTLKWSKPNPAVRFSVYRTTDPAVASTDPISGTGWQKILSDSLSFSLADPQSLRLGSVYYRVTTIGADGIERLGAAPVTVTADRLPVVLAWAEGLSAGDYTKASYRGLAVAIAAAKEAMQQPGYDEEKLVNALYDAVAGLVSVRTLLRKVQVDQAGVEASTWIWPGTGTAAQNGWLAFDGNVQTATDTTAANGWIRAKLGEATSVDAIRFHPRSCCLARANGHIFQGSNDDGSTWTTIATISGVTEFRWYQIDVSRTQPYKWLRLLDEHGGNTNIAEIEYLVMPADGSILAETLAQAKAIDLSGFTAESGQVLTDAIAAGDAVLADLHSTQQQVDDLVTRVLTAIDGLVPA